MKKQLLALASLLLVASLSTSLAARDENLDDMIRLTARPYISHGMTRDTVHAMLGAPSARISADVWVYFDSKLVNAHAVGTQSSTAADKKDTLVVVFGKDGVSRIRACDGAPVRVFIAQQEKSRPQPAAGSVAAR